MKDNRDELRKREQRKKLWEELATSSRDGEARRLADVVAEKLGHIHRGAQWLHEGEIVVFGRHDIRGRDKHDIY